MKEQTYGILATLSFNLSIVGFLALILSYFSILYLDLIINENLLLGISLAFLYLFFVFADKAGKTNIFTESVYSVSQYIFLILLLILAVNQFWKNPLITLRILPISIFSVFFGALTFYRNSERVEKEIETDQLKEQNLENKRELEFDFKFRRLAWFNFKYCVGSAWKERKYFKFLFGVLISPLVWFVRLPYSFIKWMYKEGWGYSGLLILIASLGAVLISWNLDYFQGSDNFNFMSAKALYENGHFFYPRNLQLTYLIYGLFRFFGPSMIIARLPIVFIGVASIVLIYFLGKNNNKLTGLVCSFLLATLPEAIENFSTVREYGENFLISLVITLIIINFYIKYRASKGGFLIRYAALVIFLASLTYLYRSLVYNYSLTAIILNIFLLSIPIIFITLWKHLRSLLIFFIGGILIVIWWLFKIFPSIGPFYRGWSYDPAWFLMFFDSTIRLPVQWFSLSSMGLLLIFAVFLIPLFFKNHLVRLYYFTFFLTVALFVFKIKNSLPYLPTRYLFYIYPFYIAIFSFAIVYLFYLCRTYKFKNLVTILFTIFIFSSFIILPNTYHAMNHDLDSTVSFRQVSSLGSRGDIVPLFDFLKEKHVLDKNPALVITSLDPAWFTYEFNYPIDSNRYFSDRGANTYDTASGIYLESSFWDIHELNSTLDKFDSGVFITRAPQFRGESFIYHGKNFSLIGVASYFKIYSWTN